MENHDQTALARGRERLADSQGLDRIRGINSICRELVFSDLDAVATLLKEGEALVIELNEANETPRRTLRGEAGELRRLRGVLAFYQARYAEAVQHLEAAREAFAESDRVDGPGNCWNNLAMVYRYLDDYGHALSYYQKALARAREVRDAVAEANTLGNIGILYYMMGELDRAGEHIEAALESAVAAEDEGLEMTWSSNLAELYLAQGETAHVWPLLNRAQALAEKREDVTLMMDVLHNLGTLHAREGAVTSACAAYRRAQQMALDFTDRRMAAKLLLSLGKLLTEHPVEWMEGGESNPETVLLEALRLSEAIGVRSLCAESHQALAAWYEQEGAFDTALSHLNRHARLAADEKTAETERKLQQQRLLFEVDQTQRDLAASRAANAELQREVQRRMEVEEELRRALELARHADEVKTRFLATMSHEIRTPMNGVLGMTDILSRTELDADQQEAVQVIFEAGHSLLELINDILDLTKLEADRIELSRQDFSLGEVVEAIADWSGGRMAEKGLRFSVDFPPALHRAYFGDAARIQQVLRNLLSNAIKFTPAGEVSLRFEEADRPGWLRVIVEDTGIGIPRERFETVFELFTQLDSSTTRQYGGAGLGLAIARKLSSLMNGSLHVESTLGVGSRFTLEIPLEYRDIELYTGADPETKRDRPLRVLVVEDTELNWRVVSLLLKKLDAEATWAPDGFRAVELASSENFDLVLMDIQLPGMDGGETARRIRRDCREQQPPKIVALTAYPVDDPRCPGLLDGVDSVLTKPINMERLRQEIFATPQHQP